MAPLSNAHGSVWAATLMVAPAAAAFPPAGPPGVDVMIAMLLLGVVCSGVAYLLYFRLVSEVGATSARIFRM